jgi:hypothetical protein
MSPSTTGQTSQFRTVVGQLITGVAALPELVVVDVDPLAGVLVAAKILGANSVDDSKTTKVRMNIR